MAKTSKEKTDERREDLTKLAKDLGFDSWSHFETNLKNHYKDGSQIVIVIHPNNQKPDLTISLRRPKRNLTAAKS